MMHVEPRLLRGCGGMLPQNFFEMKTCYPMNAFVFVFLHLLLQVPNFWPSISKVIGDYLPERYIFRLAIALTSFPRIMDGILYHKFFATRRPLLLQKRWYRWLNRLNSSLWITQLFLFYTCVFISSLEHMGKHCMIIRACT